MLTNPKDLVCPECGGPKSRHGKRCASCAGALQNSSETRSQRSLCGAKKKNGDLCRAYAGQGTPTPGIGRCRFHLGATPSHRKHAIEIDARRRMVVFGEPLAETDLSAPEVLLNLMRASSGYVAWLSQEVAGIDDMGEHAAQVVVRLYAEERDRLTRVSAECVKAGVAEQYVRTTERQWATAAEQVRQAAEDVGMDRKQIAALGRAIVLRQAGVAPTDEEFVDVAGKFQREEERRVGRAAEARARELTKMTDSFPPDELVPASA